MRRLACLASMAGLILVLAMPATAQQVPPQAAWRTLETEHFRVTFGPGLEGVGRRAAQVGERAYARLATFVARPPSGRIEILVSDHVDLTNGFASPFPSNRIVVWAKPPVDEPALAYNTDWVELVVIHELAHIFHLDRAGGFGTALRAVFGRVPMWPLFPALGTPRWGVEGLAVVAESELTGAGRTHGSYHDMVVRTAVLRDSFDRMDRLNTTSPIWPGDQRVYVYGSLFLDYVAEKYGEDAIGEIVDKTASGALPPFLFWDQVGKRAIGISFDAAYADWRRHLETRVTALADSLRAAGLTEAERLTDHSWFALHPRLSPDGARLAYAALDGRDVTATRVLDSATGALVWDRRRNGLGAHAWLPDGSGIVVSQLEYTSTFELRQDLYVVTPSGTRRITHDARLQDPDVARDGVRIVAVENGAGTNRLVIVDSGTGAARPLTDFAPDVHWAFPRWSPDGTRIAASRFRRGGEYDVVILDTTGAILARLTADRAIDTHPTWSPDGRWVVFSSDRSGIPNLYAADVSAVSDDAASSSGVILRQVTNVLTGAFNPDVSADARWIHFSAYDDDGFHLARMPFDPAAWRDPAPVRIAAEPVRPSNGSNGGGRDVQVGDVRGYSALRTARPTFWVPAVFADDELGTFIGAATGGADLVGRLGWGAVLTVHPGSGRWQGYGSVSLGHLGNPRIELVGSREWEDLGYVSSGDTITALAVEKEDVVGIFATFSRPRWRHVATVSVGVEATLRERSLDDTPGLQFRDPRDDLIDFVGRFGFANFTAQPFSISRENGIALSAQVEREIEIDGDPEFPREQTELTGRIALYRALHPFGFANHVVAVRASGLRRTDSGASPERIGGVSGAALDVLGLNVGPGSLLLPVRGFDRGVRWGTSAWTASAEYRAPVALIGRRPAWSPFYFDRIAALAFVDAGDAWCTGNAIDVYNQRCRTQQDGSVSELAPLTSTGAELVLDMGLGTFAFARLRAGVAMPLNGPGDQPVLYLQLGSSF